jgi:hypothetical protein
MRTDGHQRPQDPFFSVIHQSPSICPQQDQQGTKLLETDPGEGLSLFDRRITKRKGVLEDCVLSVCR